VRSRLVPFRSRLGPKPWPASSPVATDPSPAIGLACACLGPKTVGGPPARRSRRRGLGGSPSTRTKAHNGAGPWLRAAERKRGVLVAVRIRPCATRSCRRGLVHRARNIVLPLRGTPASPFHERSTFAARLATRATRCSRSAVSARWTLAAIGHQPAVPDPFHEAADEI
jgi:hypothetical protein